MSKKKNSLLLAISFVAIIIAIIVVRKLFFVKQGTAQAQIKDFSTQTIYSNQWYSSIYSSFPSQQMFAFPLAYRISQNGVELSLPTVHKTDSTIYGSFIQDFSVGLSEQLQKPTITKIGNWSITLQMQTANGSQLNYTLAQGVPSITFHTTDQQLTLRLPNGYTIYNNGSDQATKNNQTIQTEAFRLTIQGHNYIVVLPKKSNIKLSDIQISIMTKNAFIAVLDSSKNFDLFKQSAKAEVTNTVVTYNVQPKTISGLYQFETPKDAPLITLLPHQYDTLAQSEKPTVLGSYDSIRGTLRIIRTFSFMTITPSISPDETFTPLKLDHPDFIAILKQDVHKILTDNQPTEGDYFLGAWYGKAINILLLTDTAGLTKEKQELLTYLEPKLAKSLTYFHYDKTQKSMIADKPEFGNEKLNDHHFHYGYYIRAASVLTKMDPNYRKQVEPQVTKLIADIANTDNSAKDFPFLRNFDVYEGHSWADGYANFGDGNDQESSSEAINAWYGIYLWAKTTNNQSLEQAALYLFNTEITGTRYYWFGKNQIYTAPYNHAIGSIIWGGKVDFSTWFSGETNMKYGIQILPVTPASFSYLGTLGSFTPYSNDYYKNGGDLTKPWGDLFLMLQSFYQPQVAIQQKEKATKPEDNTPNSLMLYTLYRNNNE